MASMTSGSRILSNGRGVVYAIHDSHAPNDDEWDEYVSHGRTVFEQIPDVRKCCSFVATDGGAPNAKQRQRVVQLIQSFAADVKGVNTSVISENVVARGVVGVLTMFIPGVRIFAPTAFAPALSFIDVDPADWRLVVEDLETLSKDVPRARTVRALILHLRREVPA